MVSLGLRSRISVKGPTWWHESIFSYASRFVVLLPCSPFSLRSLSPCLPLLPLHAVFPLPFHPRLHRFSPRFGSYGALTDIDDMSRISGSLTSSHLTSGQTGTLLGGSSSTTTTTTISSSSSKSFSRTTTDHRALRQQQQQQQQPKRGQHTSLLRSIRTHGSPKALTGADAIAAAAMVRAQGDVAKEALAALERSSPKEEDGDGWRGEGGPPRRTSTFGGGQSRVKIREV